MKHFIGIDVGNKNLAISIVDRNGILKKLMLIDLKIQRKGVQCISEKVNNALSKYKWHNIKTVVIETQPAFNKFMLKIEMAIFQYFSLKVDCNVISLSPKLHHYKGDYHQRKKTAVVLLKRYLHMINKQHIINQFNKLDDVADSTMLVLLFLSRETGIKCSWYSQVKSF